VGTGPTSNRRLGLKSPFGTALEPLNQSSSWSGAVEPSARWALVRRRSPSYCRLVGGGSLRRGGKGATVTQKPPMAMDEPWVTCRPLNL
jgi:hypothetical protein